MYIIESKVTPLPYNYRSVYEHIEKCGRTCYHSLDQIKTGSAHPFVGRLISSQHYAMLEHASFAFEVDSDLYSYLKAKNELMKYEVYKGIYEPPCWGVQSLNFSHVQISTGDRFIVSGNVRALNNVRCYPISVVMSDRGIPTYSVPDDFNFRYNKCVFIENMWNVPNLTVEEIAAHIYYTYCIVTDRGVTHEFVRHRKMSFAQESTRYCNYSKDKFGGEVAFIKPHDYNNWPQPMKTIFEFSLTRSEKDYMDILEAGATPQQARAVLPNAVKATLIASANVQEWIHFFNVRYRGLTGAPHPDMKEVAEKIHREYYSRMMMGLMHCGLRQEADFML